MLHFICTYTGDPTVTESNDDTCSMTELYYMFCPSVGLVPCEHYPEDAVETVNAGRGKNWCQLLPPVFLPPSILCQLVQLYPLPKQYDPALPSFWAPVTLSEAALDLQGPLGLLVSEVIGISPSNLDSSLCFFQSSVSHDVLCI